jgi:hypothetical protein
MPPISPRTWMELIGTAVLAGLLVWQVLTNASLKVDVARLQTAAQADQLRVQASDVSNKSCQLALAASSRATEALASGTKETMASVAAALQRGQDRSVGLAPELTRLLSVRAAPGQDCQIAAGLARAAWEEHQ